MIKVIAFLLIGSSLYQTAIAQRSYGKIDLGGLAWLKGKWQEINLRPGHTGTETWWQSSDSTLSGKSMRLRGRDTLFNESLIIRTHANDINYFAGDITTAETFPLRCIRLKDNSVSFYNFNAEAPRRLEYRLQGSLLTVEISEGDNKKTYIFKKK